MTASLMRPIQMENPFKLHMLHNDLDKAQKELNELTFDMRNSL